jgi:hypothetical protein
VSASDYVRPLLVGNFRALWEELPADTEREDDYGLGHRDNLQARRCVRCSVRCSVLCAAVPRVLCGAAVAPRRSMRASGTCTHETRVQ